MLFAAQSLRPGARWRASGDTSFTISGVFLTWLVSSCWPCSIEEADYGPTRRPERALSKTRTLGRITVYAAIGFRGEVHKRKKKLSKKFRDAFGHTPHDDSWLPGVEFHY